MSSFVDSVVWGYADELLKQINNKNNITVKNGKSFYNYDRINRNASQVYLLLQGALAKMINRCECLIFLNTPSSIQITDVENETLTASPWIYSELLMASTFPGRQYRDYRLKHSMTAELKYKVSLDSFVQLCYADIEKAQKEAFGGGALFLDQLYQNKGLIQRET